MLLVSFYARMCCCLVSSAVLLHYIHMYINIDCIRLQHYGIYLLCFAHTHLPSVSFHFLLLCMCSALSLKRTNIVRNHCHCHCHFALGTLTLPPSLISAYRAQKLDIYIHEGIVKSGLRLVSP